ncbi:MAG: quinol:electron acceptor oxidoreductase subunit ActD, partial [Gemmatimonadaceae bacterium]
LCAMATGIAGYLLVNGLPRLWEPIDECDAMRQAMRAEWVVAVYNDDRREIERARRILRAFQPLSIEDISPALEEIPA